MQNINKKNGKLRDIHYLASGQTLLCKSISIDLSWDKKQFCDEFYIEDIGYKPENILRGIVEGKVRKMLAESVLEEQVYLMGDGTQTVGQYLKSVGVTLVKFVRYALGDGLEKRVDNFAEEVMKEAK